MDRQFTKKIVSCPQHIKKKFKLSHNKGNDNYNNSGTSFLTSQTDKDLKVGKQMVLEQLDIQIQKNELGTDIMLFTKISSKLVININVKCKNVKLLEDNRRKVT